MSQDQWSRRKVNFALLGAGVLLGSRGGAAPLARTPTAVDDWDAARLAAVAERAKRDNVAALMINHGDRNVLSSGDAARPFLLHSMRKSVLSALYGIAVARGEIDLSATLGSLNVDDDPKLTDIEKSATVRMLLEARSGVYRNAAAEGPSMRAKKPAMGSHAPGSHWYYNNWDFNMLGHIYERLTGHSIFVGFEHDLAKPLGMQDFDAFEHGIYQYEPEARYPAYHLIMSTRDLMRFGRLYLNQGRWNGKQVIPADWVKVSTTAASTTDTPDIMSGYAYLWWTAKNDSEQGPMRLPSDSYTAAGAGGHFLTVVPSLQTVIIMRVNTFDPNIRSPLSKPKSYSQLVREILAAHPRRRGIISS